MQEIFDYSIFGNTILSYLTALAIFIGGTAAVFVFKHYVLIRLKKWAESTVTTIDDLLINAIDKSLVPVFYFGAFYVALHTLSLTSGFKYGLRIAAIILITLLAVRAVTSAVNLGLRSYLKKSGDLEREERQITGMRKIINFVIWTLALVFLLDNLGVKISAVVAGLGIGGVAVALAAQAILGDLFSYFVIFLDKPFEVGDFIVVGDKMGAVEMIGIKTTRLRAIGGELLVFSNKDLTDSRVHNFKKMERRRVVFKLGVVYQTTSEKLKTIPQMVKNIIVAQNDATFDRGHFASFGDSSLDFEFVYYVTGADYTKYMDIQQAINLSVFETFEREKIEMAYPTQTLFVSKAD
jgi:small-conductance mechanosensitive channel